MSSRENACHAMPRRSARAIKNWSVREREVQRSERRNDCCLGTQNELSKRGLAELVFSSQLKLGFGPPAFRSYGQNSRWSCPSVCSGDSKSPFCVGFLPAPFSQT